MHTVPPGTLLKQPAKYSILYASPPSRRLQEHLHDLITIAYERSTNRRPRSLTLTRLEYASGENSDGKFSMHFVALVKELEAEDTLPIRLSITVNKEEWPC